MGLAARARAALTGASDYALAILSPERRLVREHFRMMEKNKDYAEQVFALMGARGYRNARATKGQTPWGNLGSRSADADLSRDLPRLRNRTREINNDDPIGSGLQKTFVNNVVGTGMQPQARTMNARGTPDMEKNSRMEAAFKASSSRLALADGLSFGGLQRMVYGKVLEDGEVFVKRTAREDDDHVWFELIEADRVSTPTGVRAADGGQIRDGVEKDSAGVPVAYWVRTRHPGDTLSLPKSMSGEFTRVPADQIKHLRFVKRPGQTRGLPFLHAVLQDLRDLDLLILAALKRAQISACLSVFIKTNQKTSNLFDVTAQRYGYQLDQQIEPGMIFKLFPDEEIQTLLPNFPSPELEPFIIMLCRRIGAALGVSWQIVLKDFSKANYSSARTDLLEARVTYTLHQRWMKDNFLNWVWLTVLEDARLRGNELLLDVMDSELAAVDWIANGWRFVDPLKEARAAKVEYDLGITTLRDLTAQQGKHWEDVQDQRLIEEKREQEKRAALGLAEAAPAKAATKDTPQRAQRAVRIRTPEPEAA